MNYPRSIRHCYGVLALFFAVVMTVTGSVSLQAQSTSTSFKINGADVISGYPLEGHLIIARTASDHKVTLDGTPVTVTEDGLFVIGFHRDSDDDTVLEIIDDNGRIVAPGKTGELLSRGYNVMQGYWDDPQLTAESIDVAGWMHTGDLATMDEEGFFKIVDRKKEMILISGFNVYPNDVEKAISENPKVLEVGVRGEKNEDGTEFVRAFIVKKDPSLTEEELIEFCRTKLTNYKVPKSISFRDELPKSNVGKILRRLLE